MGTWHDCNFAWESAPEIVATLFKSTLLTHHEQAYSINAHFIVLLDVDSKPRHSILISDDNHIEWISNIFCRCGTAFYTHPFGSVTNVVTVEFNIFDDPEPLNCSVQ